MLAETIKAQLAASPLAGYFVGPPQRRIATVAAAASPVSSNLLINETNLVVGDAIFIEHMWAILSPTAAMNLQSLSLDVSDLSGVGVGWMALGTPIATTLALSTSRVSLLFPAIPLITIADLFAYGAGVAIQPFSARLTIAFSASTLAVRWGYKYRVVHGINDG